MDNSIVEKFVAAYNAKELEKAVACYSPEAEISFFTFGTRKGVEEIKKIWKFDFDNWPDAKVTVLKILSDGPTKMFEWNWTSSCKEFLTLPSGEKLRTNQQKASIYGVDVFEVKDDRIVSHRLYFQELSLMTQFGLLGK
jgi:limonene-1,2-epoxide hydrolase